MPALTLPENKYYAEMSELRGGHGASGPQVLN